MLLVIYDIPNDRIRGKIADICLDYGLKRIQYSAFRGQLSRTHSEELMLKLKRTLGRHQGIIQSFSLCQDCLKKGTTLGQTLLPETILKTSDDSYEEEN
jgi:CRISPR-associated protein Cas2